MKKKFSWLQISDLHIWNHSRWNIMRRKYEELAKVVHPDFLVVTGDYRNIQNREAYDNALEFLNHLVQLFGLKKCDVYLVPGNHDGNVHGDERTKKLRKLVLNTVQKDIQTNCDAYREYMDTLRAGFSEYAAFVQAFYGDEVTDDRVKRPADVLCLTRKRQVNLLLLNTALCSRGNRDEKEVFDVFGLSELKPDPSLPTIVLAHHNPSCLAPSQKEMLDTLLNDLNVRAYLCGDQHQLSTDAVACIHIPNMTIPIYVCGKSAVENGDSYSDLSVIEYTCREDGNTYVQVYRYQRQQFLLANDFYHHVVKQNYFRMFDAVVPVQPTEQLYDHAYLNGPHPKFRKRKEPTGLSARFAKTICVDGEEIPVLYHELFGNARNKVQEYVEGHNLIIDYDRAWEPEYRSYVHEVTFKQELMVERQAAAQHGYTVHPKKLCLATLKENKDEQTLTATFGQNGYLEQRVYRTEMTLNTTEQQKFLDVISRPKGNNSKLDRCPWATCGGGVWVLSSDGYIAVSHRSNTNVGEVPGMLSYSASGSTDRMITLNGTEQDNTPGLSIAKEIEEELGIPRPRAEELTLISLGIDTGRYLIQFSYVWECGLSSGEIIHYRSNTATTAEEQKILFFPFRKDVCSRLLLECEFEPGAAASLNRLLEKRFPDTSV